MPASHVADALSAALGPGVGRLGRPILDKFNAHDHSALAYVADMLQPSNAFETFFQACNLLGQKFEHPFFGKDVERSERRGGAERIAAVGVAVIELLRFLIAA